MQRYFSRHSPVHLARHWVCVSQCHTRPWSRSRRCLTTVCQGNGSHSTETDSLPVSTAVVDDKEVDFDLLVIGSGPAGQKGAINAAKANKRVAIVDAGDMMGGVCVHTGTIPSKTFREAVLYLTGFRQHGFYGEDHVERDNIKMTDIIDRVRKVEGWETEIIRSQLRRNNITIIQGMASFVDAHTVHVKPTSSSSPHHHGGGGGGSMSEPAFDLSRIRFKHALITVGTYPVRPPSINFDGKFIFDSDQILHRDMSRTSLPKNLIVIGSGVISLEYASMLNTIPGSRVTIIDSRDEVLGFVDPEVLDALKHSMRRHGATFRLGERIESVNVENDRVNVHLESKKIVRGDAMLYAVGRQGNTDSLKLHNAGLKANKRGLINVNQVYQSEVPHIYAAGDVIGFPALASCSMEQGRIASNHMLGVKMSGHPDIFPFGIYTIPEISMVGKSEYELTKACIPFETGVAKFAELAKGQMLGQNVGFLKIIFHPITMKVHGVHAVGESATEIIHIGQAVLALGGTVEYFRDHVFNFPTFAEAYRVAALDGLNKL